MNENNETAETQVANYLAAIAAGKTLYVMTYTRTTKIDAKTVAKFAAAGHPVLKAEAGPEGHVLMASGRKYVSIKYATVRLA